MSLEPPRRSPSYGRPLPNGAAAPPGTGDGEDALYRATITVLQAPSGPKLGWQLVFGASLVLYLLVRSDFGSPVRVATIVAILFFHELGHLAAMRAFGYRDTRIFFIPFFGAAASGVREDAHPWQRAVVLLAGPVPGILVGIAWILACRRQAGIPWYPGELLIWINAFNLLPLEPLDGGRLLNVLIFSRHRVLEIVFVTSTSLAAGALGLGLNTNILLVLAVIGLLYVPNRYRTARAADALRARWPAVPPRLHAMGDEMKRAYFREACALASRMGSAKPALCASVMRRLHEFALTRPAPWPTAALLLAVYAFSVGLSLFGLVLAVAPSPFKDAVPVSGSGSLARTDRPESTATRLLSDGTGADLERMTSASHRQSD